jgi:hypothetical protein
MIITVISMRMVQVTIHKIINMIPVRNGLMTTVWTMNVIRIMARAFMIGSASGRVHLIHAKPMLINMILMRMVQMTIMKIVNMIIMSNREMTTILIVGMRVILMNFARVRHHRSPY